MDILFPDTGNKMNSWNFLISVPVLSNMLPPNRCSLSRATVRWAQSIWHKAQSTQLSGWHQRRGLELEVHFGENPIPALDFRCVPFDWLHQWRVKRTVILYNTFRIALHFRARQIHFSESWVNNSVSTHREVRWRIMFERFLHQRHYKHPHTDCFWCLANSLCLISSSLFFHHCRQLLSSYV